MARCNALLSALALLLTLLGAQMGPTAARKLLPPSRHGAARRLHVIGGDLADAPYVFKLDVGGGLCTGTYISPYYVLTAAHCVVDESGALLTPIVVGGEPAVSVAVHPSYRPGDNLDQPTTTTVADVAVIRVARPFAGAMPRLPTADVRLASVGWAVGYGDTTETDNADNSGIKRVAQVEVLEGCPTHYTDTICAGHTGNTCSGDSGGPLLMADTSGQLVVVGVVSHGFPCGSMAGQGVVEFGHYTDVREYVDFIARAMQA